MKIKGPVTVMNVLYIRSYEAGQGIPVKLKAHVYLILRKKHRAW